jgi:hypothetical protein
MSAPINDGGSAFALAPTASTMKPNADGAGHIVTHYGMESGMSLRDYFAAAALQPLVTSAIELDHVKWDATAQHAYLIADAMLKAREAK